MDTQLDELGPRTSAELRRWTWQARALIAVVWMFTLSFCGWIVWSAFLR